MTLDGLQIKKKEKYILKNTVDQKAKSISKQQKQKNKTDTTITNQSSTMILSQCLGKQADF